MASQHHKIGRQILELILPTEPGISNAQDAFLAAYYSDMLPILERVLDEIVGPNDFLRLDSLEIDLGKIGYNFHHPAIALKLETVVRESLEKAIEENRLIHKSEHSETLRAGTAAEIFFHFLSTGTIPNWMNANEFEVQSSLRQLLRSHSPEFRAEFLRVLSIRNVQRRLAWSISKLDKEKLLQFLSPEKSVLISLQISDLLRLHSEENLLPLRNNIFELYIWESVFGALPSISSSSLNESQTFLRIAERIFPATVFSGNEATVLLTKSLEKVGQQKISAAIVQAIQFLRDRHQVQFESVNKDIAKISLNTAAQKTILETEFKPKEEIADQNSGRSNVIKNDSSKGDSESKDSESNLHESLESAALSNQEEFSKQAEIAESKLSEVSLDLNFEQSQALIESELRNTKKQSHLKSIEETDIEDERLNDSNPQYINSAIQKPKESNEINPSILGEVGGKQNIKSEESAESEIGKRDIKIDQKSENISPNSETEYIQNEDDANDAHFPIEHIEQPNLPESEALKKSQSTDENSESILGNVEKLSTKPSKTNEDRVEPQNIEDEAKKGIVSKDLQKPISEEETSLEDKDKHNKISQNEDIFERPKSKISELKATRIEREPKSEAKLEESVQNLPKKEPETSNREAPEENSLPDPMAERFRKFKEMWSTNPEALIPQSNSEKLHIVWKTDAEIGFEMKYCGLILLWPFIPHLFRALGWMEKSNFIDEEAQFRAIIMLHFLATGSTEAPLEQDLGICKLLVGLQPEDIVPTVLELEENQLKEGEGLLEAVIQNWTILKRTSPEGLRKTFLDRSGFMRMDSQGWHIQIKRETMDILIDRIPWGVSTIRLSWQPKMIFVEW